MAGPYTWTYDATTGVYKNHFISKKIRQAAMMDMVFQQYVRPQEDFGKGKGETVNIRRIKRLALPTSGQLVENVKIPIDTFSTSAISYTVVEWGRGVEYTSLASDLEHFDLENQIQRTLRDQMKWIMDNAAAAAFKSTDVYLAAIPTGVAAITWDTDGTPSTAATVNINVDLLGIIRDAMRDTYQIPYYEGEMYMGIASTKFLRGIKTDSTFQFWRQYLRPGDVLMKSEVGMVEQIRFVESNNTNALSNAKGTGSVLGEAVIFGEDAVVFAEVEPFELRVPIPGDAGRQRGVVWYGVGQWGVPWGQTANAGEARIVKITSS